MNARVLFVHALSPLHAGTGQSYGAIDLAIARDRATDHPYLPGSSLKGSLRALAFHGVDGPRKDKVTAMYGPETANAADHAGSLAFGDANLLLLPVRSICGTFAWVTSPFLLARFQRDAQAAGLGGLPAIPVVAADQVQLTASSVLAQAGSVYFEDLDFKVASTQATPWGDALADHLFAGDAFWADHLRSHLCIVHDDVMSFLSRYATDVVTRNVLDPDSKTVKNLWDEENLPAETVLYTLLVATPNKAALRKWGPQTDAAFVQELFTDVGGQVEHPIQLGGKATVGRGRCRLVLQGGA